ncbi:MAG TPA: PKD domain-containing protein [Solirubrobacteraceae bacterium]|nr:PKD domain-containing protein [Solirubrobacteraceae bacterium]
MSLGAALAALTIGVLGAPASAASVRPVALQDIPKVASFIPPTTDHVYYHGGPVLHRNRTHVIFWQPGGSSLTFGPGYVSLVAGFLRNVAAASHSTSNVFGLTGQYTDYSGQPAAYASRFGGWVLDDHPLPANGCVEPATGPLWTHCVTDGQLQAELEHVVRQHHLPHGANDVYFLLTPRGLASCMSTTSCSDAGPPNGYCAYHGVTNDATLLYAVVPYNAVPGHCQSWEPRPNHSAADPALSVISHELAEMITDPYQTAWYANSGSEIGDICLASYGRSIGGSGQSRYNENINGGHYYLQEEWSNADSACRRRALPDQARFSVIRRSSLRLWLIGAGNDPEGHIVGYRWSLGDGSRALGRRISHRFPRAGSYRIRLRVTDNWDNWTFYARTVAAAAP